ncbi:MBL fold metallo-hydrolase [Paenarthrobacter aurescens]|jgi:L-ascorbate metabolism protein UlaG (beta-lactamase superfamily)|uniref:Metallo-beta-lactamase domain-containing protein n=1 Tax=Paenarthrobacter aurescens (strain TC1) TaxID=290340 RepID=A1RDL1_PAEAT|nr:MBL fold metallo-hydrolase [Paenarthrobacter aurescens]ABM10805.1 conserved hypothetical protein [Paenarthrobacter aurescens TC1]
MATTDFTAPIDVTLVGGPTAIIDYAGLRIVVDPTFDPPASYGPEVVGAPVTLVRNVAPAFAPDALGEVHVVLVTHDHHDHLDYSGRALAASAAATFTTEQVARSIPGAQGMSQWQTHTVKSPDGREVSITAVPAIHGPESHREALGPVIGFVISSPGDRTIYVSGDNASIEPVREVAERFPDIAVALLFAGGPSFEVFDGAYLAFSDEMAVAAAEILENAMIFPIHADSWEHFSQTAQSMKQLATDKGIGDRVIALTPGQLATV